VVKESREADSKTNQDLNLPSMMKESRVAELKKQTMHKKGLLCDDEDIVAVYAASGMDHTM
jgi:hypothetical protein